MLNGRLHCLFLYSFLFSILHITFVNHETEDGQMLSSQIYLHNYNTQSRSIMYKLRIYNKENSTQVTRHRNAIFNRAQHKPVQAYMCRVKHKRL